MRNRAFEKLRITIVYYQGGRWRVLDIQISRYMHRMQYPRDFFYKKQCGQQLHQAAILVGDKLFPLNLKNRELYPMLLAEIGVDTFSK